MSERPSRTVARKHEAFRDDIADLVTRRPVPGPQVQQVDPFLFLNHHGPQVYRPGNRGLPFGPHPHRGFETVTFILAGSLAHSDTGGHESIIHAGGVQWMTAGSGLIHAELSPEEFKREGGPLEILQLWVNLPSRLKMTEPRYTGLQADSIPTVPLGGGGTLNLVAGEFGGVTGPVNSITGVFMSTVRLPEGASADLPAPQGRSVFLYVVEGAGQIGGSAFERWQLIELNGDGDRVTVATEAPTVLLFGHADPIGEPVVAHGPFVMNTRDEIAQAVRDYNAGLFNRPAQELRPA
jgi:redox-sensitive bicupin YhaK (pirin superfamily)